MALMISYSNLTSLIRSFAELAVIMTCKGSWEERLEMCRVKFIICSCISIGGVSATFDLQMNRYVSDLSGM